ncbi:MAG: DUF456 domain-containing protein [Deltaproteobacteria bacterium]|jgi:uncharacterized protein YqgC (DUF456 family)|nr:DUF456 domain-containing protein [Deltaproteobacteria bacterium]
MLYLIFSLCLLIMIVGCLGSILPVIPGLPLIWGAYLVFGLYEGWASYGLWMMIIVTLVIGGSLALDQLATVIGAKKFGAGKAGMIGSVVCALLGLIFFNLPGLIIGAFGGAVVFEMIFNKTEFNLALKAGAGALLGFLCGSLFKFVVGAILTGVFCFLFLVKN